MELTPVAKVVRRFTHEGFFGPAYQGLPVRDELLRAQWPPGNKLEPSLGPLGEPSLPGEGPAAAPAAGDETGAGQAMPPLNDAMEQVGTLLRLGCWLALLFAGYGLQRGLCAAGMPYDCDSPNAADVYSVLTGLAFVGGALGWLTGIVGTPARFAWLFSPRRCYLWFVYAGMLPLYSRISNIPALHASLAAVGEWGPAMYAIISLVLVLLAAVFAFHIHLALQAGGSPGTKPSSNSQVTLEAPGTPPAAAAATAAATGYHIIAGPGAIVLGAAGRDAPHQSSIAATAGSASDSSAGGGAELSTSSSLQRRRRWRALWLYLLPRLVVFGYFGAWLVALPSSGAFHLHLHHFTLGWAAASFATFNHPISGLLLALGTSVFVQGVASYGFDPLLARSGGTGGCLPVSSATGQMTCAFWSADPFALKFCSDTPWIPWFDCTVPWPWPETDISRSSGSIGGAVPGPPGPLAPPAGPSLPAPNALVFAPAGEPML